jgi:hypothetical protein
MLFRDGGHQDGRIVGDDKRWVSFGKADDEAVHGSPRGSRSLGDGSIAAFALGWIPRRSRVPVACKDNADLQQFLSS